MFLPITVADASHSGFAFPLSRSAPLRPLRRADVTHLPIIDRERAQGFLKDPEIHVTTEPRFYEVALEVFPGWDVS